MEYPPTEWPCLYNEGFKLGGDGAGRVKIMAQARVNGSIIDHFRPNLTCHSLREDSLLRVSLLFRMWRGGAYLEFAHISCTGYYQDFSRYNSRTIG